MNLEHLGAGTMLVDRRSGRTVILQARINPMGLLVRPYWLVRNAATGRHSVIREDRLTNGRRWTRG